MAEVTLTINGRSFGISCDTGQEQRVMDLGHYVDSRIKDISRAGAATNESHLLVLTALMLADEAFDLRDDLGAVSAHLEHDHALKNEEIMLAQAIDQLANRIDVIADRVQKA